MANISVTINSNRELIEQASDEAVARALEAIGLKVEGYAKMKCPVDTGLLRNSITHAVGGRPPAISSYKGSSKHGDTATTRKNKVAGKPAPPPRSGTYTGSAPEGLAVYIGSNVEYAAYVEYGTQKTKAQPYLKPAVVNHADEYGQMVEHFLKNG